MADEIDILMNLDPLELSEQDIDKIIAYERAQRQLHDLGVKPKKEKGQGVSLSGVLEALNAAVPNSAPVPKITRRI